MFKRLAALAVATGFACVPLAAQASVITLNLDGVQSFDGIGAPINTVLTADLGAGSILTGIGVEVTLTAFSPSWLSELAFVLRPDSGPETLFFQTNASATSGTEPNSTGGIIDLTSVGIADVALTTGILTVEFYESFDDLPGAADGEWGGTLSLEYTTVPLPASGVMLLGAILGAGAFARRRQKS